jgi:hypothetical protein
VTSSSQTGSWSTVLERRPVVVADRHAFGDGLHRLRGIQPRDGAHDHGHAPQPLLTSHERPGRGHAAEDVGRARGCRARAHERHLAARAIRRPDCRSPATRTACPRTPDAPVQRAPRRRRPVPVPAHPGRRRVGKRG